MSTKEVSPDTPGAGKCGLCGCYFTGYGNSGVPLTDSDIKVCDNCNLTKVISARLKQADEVILLNEDD